MGSKKENHGAEMNYIFSALMAYIKTKDDRSIPVTFRKEQYRIMRKGLLSLIRIRGRNEPTKENATQEATNACAPRDLLQDR